MTLVSAFKAVSWWRLVAGVLIAPIVPLLPFTLSSNPMIGAALIFAATTACLITVTVGLPLHFVLRRLGRGEAWVYAACGAVIGNIPALFLFLALNITALEWLALSAQCIGYGVVVTLIFWFIVVRKRKGMSPSAIGETRSGRRSDSG